MLWGAAPRVLVVTLAAGLIAAAGAGPAHAQQGAVRVDHAGPDTVTVPTGERGSVAFRLTNGSGTAVAATTEITAPEGWRVVSRASELELPADSSTVRVVSFYPAAEAAGLYPLQIELRAAGGGVVRDIVHVRVPERRELAVTVEDAPEWTTAGEPFPVFVRVSNVGNARARVAISLDSPYAIPAQVDTASIWLEPGGSESIRIDVSPPADLERAVVHSMRVTAMADSVTAEAVSSVEILPGPRARREPRPGLPAEIRFRASDDPRAGPPVRFQAAGPIRPRSETRVAALLQGPTQSYSVFGEPDVYSLGIQSPNFSLDLGDNVFRLSRLTEPGRQGFGMGATARLGAFSAGGFVQRDRRSFSPGSQYAAFGGLSLADYFSLRANWLQADDRHGKREVLSGESSLRLPGWFTFQGELGVRPSTGALAESAELVAQRGPFTLNLRHLDGDPAYGGVNAGLSSGSAHLNVQVWRSLYFEGSLQDQTIGSAAESTFLESTSFDGIFFRSSDFQSTHRSARISAGWGSVVSVEAQNLERTLRTAQTFSTHRAKSVRVRLGLPMGPLALYPSIETGIGESHRSAEPQPFWRVGARTSLRGGPATFSSNVEYFTGGTLHNSVDEEGVAGTATAALRFESTSFRISANATRYLTPISRENLVIDAVLGYRLPFGHSISARVMKRASSGPFQHSDMIALLDYSIPLNLPTGGRGRTAILTVSVQDAASGAPLPNVILQVAGRRVATDRNGRLSVGGLEPGVHYIDLDRSTTGPGRIASVTMPMRIELEAGQRQNFELAILPAGGITVETSIVRASSASGRAGPGEPEPIERVVVDFRLGEQRIRRQSDSRGIIDIRDLRPGLWTVRITSADLPAFHRFDRDSVMVAVTGGSQSQISFAAIPIQRRVEIVATADLVEQRVGEGDPPAGNPPAATPRTAAPQDSQVARTAEPPILGIPAEPATPASVRELPVEAGAQPSVQPTDAAPGGTSRSGGFTISVVAGNRSLRGIAALVYGDRDLWPRIWLANLDAVSDPDRLFPGQVLRIPPAGPLTEEEKTIARRYPEQQD